MKKILFVFVLPFVWITLSLAQITVAAAANLKDAFTEIVNLYNSENPGAKVEVVFGSSGKFFQQIVSDAPFDIFFSADNDFPVKVKEQGFAAGEVKPYAIGQLVLWSSTIDVSKGLKILTTPAVTKIAIANAKLAPYGDRAVQVLNYYKIYDQAKDKLVIGENISQTAQYVSTGNTDVGFIALSQAFSPAMKGKGKYFTIEQKAYSPLVQSFVILKRAALNKEAQKFATFVTGKQAGKILVKYGYKLP